MEKNETMEGKMFYGWLNNLAMYEQQLAHLLQQLNGSNFRGLQTDAAIELDALKDMATAQQADIKRLTEEVWNRMQQLPPVNAHNQNIIPFTTLIKNNHLREQIRKVERAVFYLKYHVNKLLSIAS